MSRTHEVTNQMPPLEGHDVAYREAAVGASGRE